MTDKSHSGFMLETLVKRAHMTAPDGQTQPVLLLAIARSPEDAIAIAKHLGFPGAKAVMEGDDILQRAKEFGVREDDAKAL